MAAEGLRHSKLPPGTTIHTRNPLGTLVSDDETEVPSAEHLAMRRFVQNLNQIARELENRSRPVDEYNTGGASSSLVTVQPTYEYVPEKIESIIINGPAGNVVLTLGDRVWALTVPATQVLVIAPVALLLSRTDARTLAPSAPGAYSLELMGIADQRFNV